MNSELVAVWASQSSVTDPGEAGQAIDIPLESAHRVANEGDTDVVLIEVQRGSYFGEDDIVRLEDDFGRIDAGAGDAGTATGGTGKVASTP